MNDKIPCHILLIGKTSEADQNILALLKAMNTEVMYTDSGRDALSKLLEYDVFLIMIDMELDSSSGIDTAGLIRSSERFKHIPIVFLLSENPSTDWVAPDFGEGTVDILINPLNPYLLKQKVALMRHFAECRYQTKGIVDEENQDELELSKKELEKANAELQRLTEDLEDAIEKANQMAVEAEMATISKSGFLATMSHEIRTPLNAVIGFTDLALGTPLNNEQKEYIESIRSASNTFLELINDILDYSKIEADMIQLETIPFSLETCIHEVMTTLWMKADEKKLGLGYRIIPGIPEQVVGDPVRFKQILVNLLGNAIKFTEKGQIIIRLELDQQLDKGSKVHLSVSDSGIGIPESKWNRLFRPFSQADDTMTREYGGTGLGLAISKKLADCMNGRLWIESPNPESVDHGAVFHALLEFQDTDPPSIQALPVKHDVSRHLVLVCHTDPVMARLYGDILNDYGMDTTPFTDPSALLAWFGKSHDSGKVAANLLLDDPRHMFDINVVKKHIKGRIVVLSSHGHPDKASDENSHGLDVIRLRKPFKTESLVDCLIDINLIDERAVTEEVTENDRDEAHIESLKVLLVEDNKINQKVTLKMLKRLGHQTMLAENGKEALDILEKQHDVDLVLMDGQMPVMDGFQATEIIRLKEKEKVGNKHIPIIALTASAMKGDRKKYIDSGMDAYVAKPVRLSELSDAIHRVWHQQF